VFWFVNLREVDAAGKERVLTRGWLRGSHREVDTARSQPWEPFFPHTRPEPLTPGTAYEFTIPIMPTANLFRGGSRIKLQIACTDEEPDRSVEPRPGGHLRRQGPSRVTVYHNDQYPSHLLVPITRGNIIGTYISAGAR
jgi:predicted acyl esterase